MHSYEVRVCIKKRWTTEFRCFDRDEALEKGRLVAIDRSVDGVKVIEESYDEEQAIFKEKNLFSYFKQEEKVAKAKTTTRKQPFKKNKAKKARAGRIRFLDRLAGNEKKAWSMVAALILSLCINVGVGFFFGVDLPRMMLAAFETAEPTHFGKGEPVIYELPAVTMKYGSFDEARTIKVKLGLELNSKDQIKNIEDRLAKIIASVANDLSAVQNEMLYDRQGLRGLRKALYSGIQTAAGQVPVNGILFKEIIVF